MLRGLIRLLTELREKMAHLTCWVWTLCVAGYAASVSAEDIVGYRFLSWPDLQEIDTSEVSFSTRSRIDCARGCRKYEHCLSFSFDPVTRTCFISPTATTDLSSSQTPSAHKHRIFEMSPGRVEISTSPPVECPESDLAGIDNAEYVTRRSLTSLYADVSCLKDFTLGEGVNGTDGISQRKVTLTCAPDTSQWVPATGSIQCKRSTWRAPTSNLPSGFPLPRTITVSWSMCLEGQTTLTDTFGVGIWTKLDPPRKRFVAPFRLRFFFPNQKELCVDSKPSENEGWTTPCQTFPMPSIEAGVLFRIRLRAMDVNTMAIYVDDVLIGKYTSSLEFSTTVEGYVAHVPVVTWQMIDVWC